MRGTTEERFWAKVEVRGPGECWEWTASKDEYGYGNFWFRSQVGHATRYVMERKTGRVLTDNEKVCHTCDNPGCVNEAHLFIGTHSDNMLDMVGKGRWSNGNVIKTHCKRGHEFTDDNTRINSRGQRVCKQCDRELQLERYHNGKHFQSKSK